MRNVLRTMEESKLPDFKAVFEALNNQETLAIFESLALPETQSIIETLNTSEAEAAFKILNLPDIKTIIESIVRLTQITPPSTPIIEGTSQTDPPASDQSGAGKE